MPQFMTKPVQVTAVRWIDTTTLQNLVGPYRIPANEDDEQENFVCPDCNNAMSIHGVLLKYQVGRIVCPNSWLIEYPNGRGEILRNKAFQARFVAV